MIVHVVMWRLREDAKGTEWPMLIDRIQRSVEALRNAIPGLHQLSVRAGQNDGPDTADLVLYGEFTTWASLKVYETHPLHDELRSLIGAVRIERRVVDYEV